MARSTHILREKSFSSLEAALAFVNETRLFPPQLQNICSRVHKDPALVISVLYWEAIEMSPAFPPSEALNSIRDLQNQSPNTTPTAQVQKIYTQTQRAADDSFGLPESPEDFLKRHQHE